MTGIFESGKLYRHCSTLDLDMYVTGPVTVIDGKVNATFLFWNRHYKFFHNDRHGFMIRERVTIPLADMGKWTEVEEQPPHAYDPQCPCARCEFMGNTTE